MARKKKLKPKTRAGIRLRQGNGQHRRAPARDRGTPELQSRRAHLAGQGDPALTTFPLGVMLANGLIGQDEYKAGCRYAYLHAVVFGKDHLVGAREYERVERGRLPEMDDEDFAELQAEVIRAVVGMTYASKAALEAAVVYEKMPPWLVPSWPTEEHVRYAAYFRAGLNWLAQGFDGQEFSGRRKAA